METSANLFLFFLFSRKESPTPPTFWRARALIYESNAAMATNVTSNLTSPPPPPPGAPNFRIGAFCEAPPPSWLNYKIQAVAVVFFFSVTTNPSFPLV